MLTLPPSGRHPGPDVWGFCLLQEIAAAAQPAQPVGGAGDKGKAKAKTQKLNQPPAGTPAPPEHHQVGCLVLGSLPVLPFVPPPALSNPILSKVYPSFTHSVILFWGPWIQPQRRPGSCHHGSHSTTEGKTKSKVRHGESHGECRGRVEGAESGCWEHVARQGPPKEVQVEQRSERVRAKPCHSLRTCPRQ